MNIGIENNQAPSGCDSRAKLLYFVIDLLGFEPRVAVVQFDDIQAFLLDQDIHSSVLCPVLLPVWHFFALFEA
jgi:hypothetical protein